MKPDKMFFRFRDPKTVFRRPIVEIVFGSIVLAFVFHLQGQSVSSTGLFKMQPDPFELASALEELPVEESSLPKRIDLSRNFPEIGEDSFERNPLGSALKRGMLSVFFPEQSFAPTPKDFPTTLLEALFYIQSKGWNPKSQESSSLFSKNPSGPTLARKFRIGNILSVNTGNFPAIKQALQNKLSVPFSFLVYDNLISLKAEEIYQKESGGLIGLQAMFLVGYDEDKKAFQVWSSMGSGNAESKFLWISYSAFLRLTQNAYVIFPKARESLLTEREVLRHLNKNFSNSGDLVPPRQVFASRGEERDSVFVNWNSVPQAIGYEIYRKRKGDSNFDQVGVSRVPYFQDLGVQENIAYTYKIKSLAESQSSPYSLESNEGYSSPKPTPIKTRKVMGIRASQGGDSERILVSWDPTPGAKEYSLVKWDFKAKAFRPLAKTASPFFWDSKPDRGGDTELYRVGVEGQSQSFSDLAWGHVELPGEKDPSLDIPTASKGQFREKVIVEWKPKGKAIRYAIFRKSKDSEWRKIGETDSNRYEDKDGSLVWNQYSISAIFDEGSFSEPSFPTVGFATFLASRSMVAGLPRNLKVTESPKEKKFTLQWEADSATSFTIFSRKLGSSSWKKIKEIPGNQRKLDWDFQGKNELEYYAISAQEEGLPESGLSNEVLVAYYTPIQDTKKARAFGESPLSKFIGPWTAMYWDGKSSVKPVRLEISVDDFATEMELKWNQRYVTRGRVVSDSTVFDETGKWKIIVSPDADSITAEVNEKGILPERTKLSFIRE